MIERFPLLLNEFLVDVFRQVISGLSPLNCRNDDDPAAISLKRFSLQSLATLLIATLQSVILHALPLSES